MLRVSGREECADEVPLSAEIGGSDRLEGRAPMRFCFFQFWRENLVSVGDVTFSFIFFLSVFIYFHSFFGGGGRDWNLVCF